MIRKKAQLKKLINYAEYLKQNNMVLLMSPAFKITPVRVKGHTYTYYTFPDYIITPGDIINDRKTLYNKAKWNIENVYKEHEELMDAFSRDIDSFTLELLTDDWCDPNPVDGTTEFCSLVNDYRDKKFNAPKVCFMLYTLRKYYSTAMCTSDFCECTSSPCFTSNIADIYCRDTSISLGELIDTLYNERLLRRCD